MKIKRWVMGAAAAIFLLPLASGRAESPLSALGRNVVLQLTDSCVLIGADGTELVAPGQYTSISSISPRGTAPESELFSATVADSREYLLLGGSGEPLTGAEYQFLIEEDGRITFQKDDLYGVMDRELNVVIPNAYTQLVSNGEGGYVALTASLLNDRAAGVFYLEPGEPETPTGVRILYDLGDFSEGRMPLYAAENKKVGYINGKGEWVVAPQYSFAGPYKGGRAVANLESGVGVIDESGNWLLTPNYRAIYRSLGPGNLFLGVRSQSAIHLIDPETFEAMRTFSGDAIYCGVFVSDELAVIYDDDASRLIDATGEVLMDFDADAGFEVYAGGAERVIVRMDVDGETLSSLYALDGTPLFGPVQSLRFLGRLSEKKLYTYAKFDVEVQTEPAVDWIGAFEVDGTRETGIVDEDGEILVSAGKYRDIAFLTEGFFAARTDEAVYIIDEAGRELAKYDL